MQLITFQVNSCQSLHISYSAILRAQTLHLTAETVEGIDKLFFGSGKSASEPFY